MKKLLFSLFSIFILLVYPLQAKEMSVPTIVGEDDRKEITGRASKPEQAVVIIEIKRHIGHNWEESTCSGTMIGPRIVLTAAHCINKGEKYVEEVKVYAVGLPKPQKIDENTERKDIVSINNLISENVGPLRNYVHEQIEKTRWVYDESGEKLYPIATAKQLWVPDKYINEYHNKPYDYGLIVLDYNLGNITGWLGLKSIPAKKLKNKEILVVGYHGIYSDRSLCRAPGRVGMELDPYICYDADVVHGNSGSPVFEVGDKKNIIAIDKLTLSNQSGPFYDDWVPEGYPNCGLLISQEIIDDIENFKKEISETNQK